MRAASGSWPTRAADRGHGSCRWRWPDSGSLGHRGAFAADGASSDGAGLLLPLEPRRAGAPGPGQPPAGRASSRCSCRGRPRAAPTRARAGRGGASPRAAAGAVVARRSRRIRLRSAARPTPVGRRSSRRSSIGRRDLSDARFELRLVLARRRMEAAARVGRRRAWPGSPCRRRRAGPSSTRASSPAIGWPTCFPDLTAPAARQPRDLPPALCDEHPSRMAAGPAVPGDRPQRRDQHGPDEPRPGRRPGGRSARRSRARPASASSAAGPLAVARRVRLAVARRGARAARRDRLGPRDGAAGADPRSVGAAVLRPPTGRRVRAPDGRLPRAVGRTGGARLRRRPASRRPGRPERARGRSPSRSPATGSWPRPRRPVRSRSRRPRRPGSGGSGPGELLLVDPRRGAILEDVEAKTEILRRSWRPDAPRTAFADRPIVRNASPGSGPPTAPELRHVAGLDAERARLDIRTMVLDGQGAALEHGRRHADAGPGPDRSTGDGSSPPGLCPGHEPADRPGARAGRDGSPRRARASPGAARRHADRSADRSVSTGRSSPDSTRWSVDSDRAACVAWTRPGRPPMARPASATRSTGWRPTRCSPSRPARSNCWRSATGRCRSIDRRSRASSRSGAVHTALSQAGLRGRADLVADSVGHPRRPWPRDGDRDRRNGGPSPPRHRAGGRAGRRTRGAEEVGSAEAVGRLLDAFEAGLRKTLARMGISAVASYVGGALFETLELAPEVVARCFPGAAAWPGRVGFAAFGRTRLRRLDVGPDRWPRPATARSWPIRVSPASAATASSTCMRRRWSRPSRPSPTGRRPICAAASSPRAGARRSCATAWPSAGHGVSGPCRSTRSSPPGRSPAGSSPRP